MELKDRILQEAGMLFFNNGIKSVTMSDIAESLGISKRTLYEVFRDKDDLLESCVNAHLNRADCEMDAMTHSSEDVIDTLMRIYAHHLREVRDVQKSVLRDLRKYYPQIYKKIEIRQTEGHAVFKPLFKKGAEEGLIREDINFEILFWLVKAQFKALMDDEFIPTDKYSTDQFIRAIILTFIRGIATPAGHKKIDAIMANLEKQENKQN
ncbi:MAG: TetR/AcrR family transcriptional regulator [Candidatus Symbiothrix sp.]|jgi:AcrR family transcriptional regulator|nr:TetR/AcrR family transcriptional regulator [Candidatus Symbiothrix sp.]